MKGFLDYAHERGAILYYDVNFRASHQHEVMKITPNLLENFELADIVRGSAEDFEVLFKKRDAQTIYRSQIAFYTKKFIYTQGADAIHLFAENGLHKEYPVAKMDTVSTIGAGDNFNAGFLYGLIKNQISRDDMEHGLSEEQWDAVIGCAQQFSAEACRTLNNYVSPEFGVQRQQELAKVLAQEEI